jgi:nucleotide-binding universal stress UspA family protein
MHVQEQAATVGEDPQVAEALVQAQVARLNGKAVGQVLRGTSDHGDVGLLIAERANQLGARAIVIGAPTHGGLSALMDASASRELWRHAKAHIMIVNPALNAAEPQPVGSRA